MEEKVKQQYDRWLAQPEMPADLADELNSIAGDEEAITDRFYRELEFGTGGLRGVIGAGTNRMNVYNIRKATQGLANYLNASDLPKKVAIGYDSRIKSDVFARETAVVLAANGIKAYLYPRLEPTPALSWAVRYYGCGAGVCVTASHNPAKYNGYKVYGADGCQITLEVAAKILAAIEAVDCFAVQPADFDAALAEGKIEYSSEKCLDDFVDAVYAQHVGDGAGIADLKLVYTPLNGSGLECVKKLLAKLGVSHVTVVPEQEKPDGSFPTCPYPNPEIREAMQKGLELCDKVHPDLLLGTDPDCDRCGTAVPDGKGGYRLITGNEMGIILLDYICRTRRALGTMPEHPVAVTTIVSTDMATPVAEKYGVELRRTLTGFKFIGEQIGRLEAAGEADRYIFGFEESYGYLSGGHVRDKDAVNATLLVCEAAAWYAQQGKTLLQMCQPSRPREGPQTLLAVLQAALTIPHQAFPGLEQTLPPLLPLLPRPFKTAGGRTQAQAALATLEPVFLPLQPPLACALQRQGKLVRALPVFAPQGPEQLGRVGRGSRTNVGRHVGQGHVHFMADTGKHRDF